MSSAIVSSLVNPLESIVQIFSEHVVQVSRWLVQGADGEQSEQVLVCSAAADPLSKKLMADLNMEIPGQVSAVVEETQGFARVHSEDGSRENAFHVAASVAVRKASWGWDESRPIVVRVDDDEFEIYPSFDGRAWIAKDRP
jgi:hypothetical protein